jgi:F-type H+-transporting ATPase subunit delta
MEDVLDEHFSVESRQFIKMLLSKKRVELMIEIIDYIRIHYSHGEAIDALIKTSYPLDLELVQKIENKLEKRFNRKLNFYLDLDASLLGGIQVTIGNTVIDGSVRRRLAELRDKLMTIRIS